MDTDGMTSAPPSPPPDSTELDARGVEPPSFTDAVVEALARIPPGTPQYVRTAERPASLLALLESRGVSAAATQDLTDGSFRTALWILSRSERAQSGSD
ncbi:MAG: hypothetical protein ACREFX_14720 [Opitutaceae bacterium]